MAASGINEHHEACRKQNVVNRQSYTKKQLLERVLGADGNEGPSPSRQRAAMSRACGHAPGHLGDVSSYDVEKYYKHNSADGTDRARRKAVQQEQYLTYSAKIKGRLSSQDYVQQW